MMVSPPSGSPRHPSAAPAGIAGTVRLLPWILFAVASVLAARPSGAQEVPGRNLPVTGGIVETGLHLRSMTGVRRVLVVGAHPDDEDTALLAELDRHRGVRAAYLSLTRGEGGQNLIGPELGKGLGLIRTGELLAARRLDGAEQYFSRAYDFGYSKTARETFRHWPREELLSDVVWVIRTFRPHVVVSVFSGTEADGHGQHQVAGLVTREAFRAAADPARFPEHLDWGARPWRALKLYRRAWRDPERATLRIATGEYDPLLGRSAFQLAMESRSQHRSQDFGVAQPPGPRYTRLHLLQDRTGAGPTARLFAGIDTSLASLARELPDGRRTAFRRAIGGYVESVVAARDSLRALEAGGAIIPLGRAVGALREAAAVAAGRAVGSSTDREDRTSRDPVGAGQTLEATGGPERLAEVLDRKQRLAERALLSARRIVVRFRAEEDRWVPGETVRVHAELWNGGTDDVRAGPPVLDLPGGWRARLLRRDSVPRAASALYRFYGADPPIRGGSGPTEVPGDALARWTFEVRVPAGADPSVPYFLARDTVGDLYRWPTDGAIRARPLNPPVAVGSLPVRAVGAVDPPLTATSPVRYRGVDKARGEFWRPVHVVPRASVDVSPRVVVWPTGAEGPEVTVSLRSVGAAGADARLSLDSKGPLAARPAEARVRLDGPDQRASETFRLSGGAAGGDDADGFRTYRLRARARPVAETDGLGSSGREAAWERSVTLVDYPHIDPVPLYRDATVRVERFPVRVESGRRVGYVMGSGDEVPEAIRQLGLRVEMLGPNRVRAGDFDGLDVIVLGVRAYEVREDLRAANDRLLAWVRAGGTLLVQYNKYEFEEGGFAPFEVGMARPHDRVTDERSPVEMLAPESPVLASPNRITERDFRGWIQERGLYFLHDWPRAMTPVLAMSDPDEEPKRGSLLVAPLGEGLYVYTGLAFFRQLPAGVPGAYRVFANLLSLEPAEWRAWLEGTGRGGGDASP